MIIDTDITYRKRKNYNAVRVLLYNGNTYTAWLLPLFLVFHFPLHGSLGHTVGGFILVVGVVWRVVSVWSPLLGEYDRQANGFSFLTL